MTPRQRTLEALLFGHPDRVPLEPGGARFSTRENWHAQGLPRDVENYNEYAYRLAGGKLPMPGWDCWLPVNERMIPQFEQKVIEQRGATKIVQDWKGNVCEIASEFPLEFLRNAEDFVTRRWIKCPVESRADWEEMKKRYNAGDETRYDMNGLSKIAADGTGREYTVVMTLSGPFWQLREWLGFENLCELTVEDPGFVREMAEFWGEYVAGLMERAFKHVIPDKVLISEDMAFKMHAMVSPAAAREFFLPVWLRWGEIIRKAGVPIYEVDSDGFIDELIPVWLEAGINVCQPMEVAAGSDINVLRKKYGRKVAFRGGVDKRAMAKGGKVIENEIRRLEPVIRGGGYIPSCDHGVPNDVSWPNYLRYVELLAKATGWL